MSTDKIKLGKFGEKIAAKYLQDKGYELIVQNFYTREGEIDLVCKKNKVIHFVEVKTKTNKLFGWPEEEVTDEKLENIIDSAEIYLEEKKIKLEWQIDIVSIVINRSKNTAQIKYFENITT